MMGTTRVQRLLIEAMAKHLPPSGPAVRLIDVGGRAGAILYEMRPDIEIVLSPRKYSEWNIEPGSVDAVVAFGRLPEPALLDSALTALRPGGRLIVMNEQGEPDDAYVRTLEQGGYNRILVETGAECPLPVGVLMRGEKPHTESHPVDRIKKIASQGDTQRQGRYVHLLIRQNPDKPAWKLSPEDKIEWQAVGVAGNDETVALAFSSLPKAVEFMQPVVKAGKLAGVNKIAKFKWDVARAWPFPMMLNPTSDIFETYSVAMVQVDPATAEAPDE
jgi:hypothetical protein